MRNGRKNSPVSGPAVPNGAGKRGNGGEFEIIARYFAPLATNPAALGLLDDAAVLSIPEGQELVATCDTIIGGVHFLTSDPPDTIAYKALAVSLSDLAAKGARPHVYLLSVAFGERPLPPWLEAFAMGCRRRKKSPASTLLAAILAPPLGRSPSPSPRLASCRKARRCCEGGP